MAIPTPASSRCAVTRKAIIPALAAASLGTVIFLPPVKLGESYLQFADRRTILGIPNFSNVVSNLPFLFVAIWGLRALRRKDAFLESWERWAYIAVLFGAALTAFGSAYFHAWPSDATLVWDRLPMTIIFMAFFAVMIGERLSSVAGRVLLVPLLVAGIASVLYWARFDDLRFYGLVQYFPMIAIPLMVLLFPPRYSNTAGVVWLMACYALAKIFELIDWQLPSIALLLPTGLHPWKHAAAAAGLFCYIRSVEQRAVLWYSVPK